MNKSWVLFSLFNFLIAAIMGLILRGAFVWEIGWMDYRNMMHGHSHVAMLGWIYLALYTLLGARFVPCEDWGKPAYSRLFWFTQFTVFGMMVSFPMQGYGAVSITFSTLHILASYVFAYRLWKDHRTAPEVSLLLKTALVLMVISTIGVWSLGPLTISGGRGSTLYQLAIQFYLHFQFHGWFTFAVLSLVMDVLAQHRPMKTLTFKRFYYALLGAVVLTYGLVLAWGYEGPLPLLINGGGLLLQVAALLLFFRMTAAGRGELFRNTPPISKLLYQFGLLSWIAKTAIQTIVLLPAAAAVALILRPLMVGFIHLTMLGFISGLLFALLYGYKQGLPEKGWAYVGVIAFMIGFVTTELLLFTQGMFYWFQWGQLPAYYEALFAASVLLPLSIGFILVSMFKNYSLQATKSLITTP